MTTQTTSVTKLGYPVVGIKKTEITPCPAGYFKLLGKAVAVQYRNETVKESFWLLLYSSGIPPRLRATTYPDSASASTGLQSIIANGGNPIIGFPKEISVTIQRHCVVTLEEGKCCKKLKKLV